MAYNYSNEVVLRDTAKAAEVPLKEGVCSLNKVYQALIEADVDPFTGECSNYDYIRQQIVQAHQHLQCSDRAASSGLEKLDRTLERLIEAGGKLERELNETKQTLDNLRTRQTSNEELLRRAHNDVSLARTNLNSAKQTLRDQENRHHNANVMSGVGAGLLVIPVVGWIAGSAMLIAGAAELAAATQAAKVAEEEVRKSETELEKYEAKISDYKLRILQTEQNISRKDEQLRQTREETQNMKEQLKAVGKFQRKLRSAVHLLGALSGNSRVVEHQTRRFILLEPVMKVMEEVMNAMKMMAGNELLYSEHISRLMEQMEENHRRLKAICASQNNAEDYY